MLSPTRAVDARGIALQRIGIVVGSAVGNLSGDRHASDAAVHPRRRAREPLLFPNLVLNAPASYASMETARVGPNLTVRRSRGIAVSMQSSPEPI
jgi:3-oxoacyl-(acyl-carrier-protein) synthase